VKAIPPIFFAFMLSILGLRLLPVFSRSGRIASIYTGLQVSCLSQEKKQIARVAAHENGNYGAALPLGNYVLDVQDRERRRSRARHASFHGSVKSDRARGHEHRHGHSVTQHVPGEMADADFGYVDGAPGKVNLYVGKTPVKFNIPEAEAVDRLKDLIREHGKWVEPPHQTAPAKVVG
jgi:hypothetical protein